MKLNNNQIPFINLSLLSTILICFALGKCMAHSSRRAYPPEASQYSRSPQPLPFPDYEETEGPSPSPSDGVLFGHSNSPSSSFSASFLDMLKATLRGHLTMPEHINSQTKDNNPALKKICDHTDYPDVCLYTISPLLNGNFDVKVVLQASMKACSVKIKMAMAEVEKQAASSSQDSVGSTFADCREQYSNALENIQRAMDAVQTRDLGTVTIMLSAVVADVSTCESGFEDLKSSYKKPDSDGLVGIMASNCLAIAALVPR